MEGVRGRECPREGGRGKGRTRGGAREEGRTGGGERGRESDWMREREDGREEGVRA